LRPVFFLWFFFAYDDDFPQLSWDCRWVPSANHCREHQDFRQARFLILSADWREWTQIVWRRK
jgi:hypothetical protein